MGHNYVVLDSSVIIAFYSTIDTFHNQAVDLSFMLDEKTSVVHPYIIQETTTILTYRFGIEAGHLFLESIQRAENIFVPKIEIEKEINYFRWVNKKISFTDIALIRLAKEMGAPLLTFDKQILSLMKKL